MVHSLKAVEANDTNDAQLNVDARKMKNRHTQAHAHKNALKSHRLYTRSRLACVEAKYCASCSS